MAVRNLYRDSVRLFFPRMTHRSLVRIDAARAGEDAARPAWKGCRGSPCPSILCCSATHGTGLYTAAIREICDCFLLARQNSDIYDVRPIIERRIIK